LKATFIDPYDKLHLIEVDGSEGVLEQPLQFYSAELGLVVVAPAGMETDFASIPRGLWNIFPKRGKHDRGAVLHDAGYRGHLQSAAGTTLALSKHTIDRLFREAMGAGGVGRVSRNLMYRAVSWFGGTAFENGQRIAEAQRVDAAI
jgi:Protein of unknown function (DUF1353)